MDVPLFIDIFVILGIGILLLGLLYVVLIFSKIWNLWLGDRIRKALLMRRSKTDDFRSQNGFGWDYVLVFKVYDEDDITTAMQQKFSMKLILGQLGQASLETRLHYSLLRKLVFCKIRAKLPRLLLEADRINYNLPTDLEDLRRLCTIGRSGYWKGLTIPEISEETTLSPYESIYFQYKYSKDAVQEMMMVPKDKDELEQISDEEQEHKLWMYKLSSVYKRRNVHFVEELANKESLMTGCLHSLANCCRKLTPQNVQPARNRRSSFDRDNNEDDSYQGDVIKETILRGIDRVKLISSIIKNKQTGGAALDIETLLHNKCIVSAYSLHDYVELSLLESKVLQILQWPWNIPIDDIKDYFGEKIGLYYSLLNFYTSWLLFASIITFFLWIDVASTNNANASTVPFIAVFICIWATVFLEFWARKEQYTAMRWGMSGFEATESERPSFEGKVIQSAIDGKPFIHVSVCERVIQSLKSYFKILGATTVIVGWLAIIFLIRRVLSSSSFLVATVVSSLIFAILIQVLNPLYMRLAVKLNDKENHRTDTEYEDALISKMFVFQFINSYSPLFYIAFMKPFFNVDPCLDTCMLELEVTLGCLFLFRITYNCLVEVVYPLVASIITKCVVNNIYHRSGLKQYETDNHHRSNAISIDNNQSNELGQGQSQGLGLGLTEIESSYLLPEYNHVLSSCADYSAFVIQFGYTTMFVAAFPLAPLASFLCNYIQLRIDSWKLCQTYRRPIAKSAEDIGQWYFTLQIISYITAVTNAAIITYTGTFTDIFSPSARAWIFILTSVGLICLKLGLQFLIPDTPQEVEIQLQRQQFIEDKLARNLEDGGGKITVTRCVPKYVVNNGDDDPL